MRSEADEKIRLVGKIELPALSVDDKMIIKLHNWIYFLTSIMFIIKGKQSA